MIEKQPSSLREIFLSGGLHWYEERRKCNKHGNFKARVVYLGSVLVSRGACPDCERLRRQEEAREKERVQAQRIVDENRRAIEKALGRACIPEEFLGKSFDNFIADTENLAGALKLARRFVSGWQTAKKFGYGLLFYGNPGTGKSHLAISILKSLLPAQTGLYTRVPDMVGYIRSGWRPESDVSAYFAARQFIDIDLLVLDELGVQTGSVAEQNLLFEVLDARLSENRPTILLSNLSPKDLVPIVGERLVDRIKGKCVPYCFNGRSRRRAPSPEVFGPAANDERAA